MTNIILTLIAKVNMGQRIAYNFRILRINCILIDYIMPPWWLCASMLSCYESVNDSYSGYISVPIYGLGSISK